MIEKLNKKYQMNMIFQKRTPILQYKTLGLVYTFDDSIYYNAIRWAEIITIYMLRNVVMTLVYG